MATGPGFQARGYQLIEVPPLSNDERLVGQLREASRSAVSQVSEGFGRFDPLDFARFVKMARASIVERKNHLVDAVDAGVIFRDNARGTHQQGQCCARRARWPAGLPAVAGSQTQCGTDSPGAIRTPAPQEGGEHGTRKPDRLRLRSAAKYVNEGSPQPAPTRRASACRGSSRRPPERCRWRRRAGRRRPSRTFREPHRW